MPSVHACFSSLWKANLSFYWKYWKPFRNYWSKRDSCHPGFRVSLPKTRNQWEGCGQEHLLVEMWRQPWNCSPFSHPGPESLHLFLDRPVSSHISFVGQGHSSSPAPPELHVRKKFPFMSFRRSPGLYRLATHFCQRQETMQHPFATHKQNFSSRHILQQNWC